MLRQQTKLLLTIATGLACYSALSFLQYSSKDDTIIEDVINDSSSYHLRNLLSIDNDVEGDLISPAESGGSTKLIHVISPFHDKSAESFAPLNYEQWTTLVNTDRSRLF